jgi:hypothetical protein
MKRRKPPEPTRQTTHEQEADTERKAARRHCLLCEDPLCDHPRPDFTTPKP